MTEVPEQAIFGSVVVYSKIVSCQCNLSAQIEQGQDKNNIFAL